MSNGHPGNIDMPAMAFKSRFSGFTLLELLITIIIISVLATIAIPGFNNMQQRRRLDIKLNRLQEIRTAQRAYYLGTHDMGGGTIRTRQYTNDLADPELHLEGIIVVTPNQYYRFQDYNSNPVWYQFLGDGPGEPAVGGLTNFGGGAPSLF